MEWIAQVLQLPIVIERRGSLVRELQPFEKGDFLGGRIATEDRVLEEFF
jgi:hypothetical protein